jgi:hypothetical protein
MHKKTDASQGLQSADWLKKGLEECGIGHSLFKASPRQGGGAASAFYPSRETTHLR